jgi:hypothetical protein
MADIEIDSIYATYEIRGDRVAMMCPPHPLMGGSRFDIRLERISVELLRNNISTLRFDYREPFRGGIGEIEDAKICLSYLKDRHSSVVVIGYSFGSLIASNIAEFCEAAVFISPLPKMNSVEFKDAEIPKLFIIAVKDQFISLNQSLKLFEKCSEPKKIIKLNTDHFYFGVFDILTAEVRDFILSLES